MKGKMWMVVVGVGLAAVIVWANFFTGGDLPAPTNTPIPTVTVTGTGTPQPSATPTPSATDTPSVDGGNVDGEPSDEDSRLAMENAKTYWQTLNTYGYGDTKVSDAIRRAMPMMTAEKRGEWQPDLADIDTSGDANWKALVKGHKINLTVVAETKIQEWSSDDKGVIWVALKYHSGKVDAGATAVSKGASDQYVAVRMVLQDGKWLASEERPVD